MASEVLGERADPVYKCFPTRRLPRNPHGVQTRVCPRADTSLAPTPAVHADDFAFLSLCFFLWKVGVVVSTSLARREDGVKWCA